MNLALHIAAKFTLTSNNHNMLTVVTAVNMLWFEHELGVVTYTVHLSQNPPYSISGQLLPRAYAAGLSDWFCLSVRPSVCPSVVCPLKNRAISRFTGLNDC